MSEAAGKDKVGFKAGDKYFSSAMLRPGAQGRRHFAVVLCPSERQRLKAGEVEL
jgi:hypothetical protein